MPTRADIVRIAREYIGMRFVHQGRGQTAKVNGRPVGGIDCAGLIVVVGHRVGVVPEDVDVPVYHRTPDGKTIREMLTTHGRHVPLREAKPGDILVFKWPTSRFPQHMGFLSELPDGRPGLIHSFFDVMKVVETGYTSPWPERVVGCFGFRGLEDE
jgi:cell wall-associated NlpC family hydrolase